MKRSCPFDPTLLRMSKVHLMEHDVDKSAMQRVKERTLKMLMQGGREHSNENNNENKKSPELPDFGENIKKPFKQLEVTQYLNNPPKFRTKQEQLHESMDVHVQCFYCDNKALSSACCVCNEYYCGSCSFVRYSQANEEYVCLSCV